MDLSQKVDSLFCLSKEKSRKIIWKRESVVILGSSGSEKSILLNILGGPDKIRCMEIIDSPSDSCKMVLVVIKEVPYKIERCRVRRRQ